MMVWQDEYLAHLVALFPRPDEAASAEQFARARSGDESARRQMMGSLLWIAWDAAKPFEGLSALNLRELVEEANAAILVAWESFRGDEAIEFIEHTRAVVRDRLVKLTLSHGP